MWIASIFGVDHGDLNIRCANLDSWTCVLEGYAQGWNCERRIPDTVILRPLCASMSPNGSSALNDASIACKYKHNTCNHKQLSLKLSVNRRILYRSLSNHKDELFANSAFRFPLSHSRTMLFPIFRPVSSRLLLPRNIYYNSHCNGKPRPFLDSRVVHLPSLLPITCNFNILARYQCGGLEWFTYPASLQSLRKAP